MPIESFHIKAQCQTSVWFHILAGLYRIGFEFLSGMCLSGFICSQTPAVTTMYELVDWGDAWLGYFRFEIAIISAPCPWIIGCSEDYAYAIEAFLAMCLSIAPTLPKFVWPPMELWIGKCEDFWKLRDAGVY